MSAVTETVRMAREVPWGLIEYEERPTGYRAYHITREGKKRVRVPSVTTALGVLEKGALLRWYETIGVEDALTVERAGRLADVRPVDAAEVLRANGYGAEARAKQASGRGRSVHDEAQRFIETGEPPNLAEHPPEHRGYLRSLVRWKLAIDRRGFELERAEYLVAHPELLYAGRPDLRARVGGFPHIIDFKTNRHGRVWPDHHYQPVAYAHADEACGAEPVLGCLIVALGPDGIYEEMRACAAPADFIAVLDVHRRALKIESAAKAERKRSEALAA